MADVSRVIEPKSDQLNADDLATGPRTITIRDVAVGNGPQPVSVFFDGDNGKPWRPCKTMTRLMASLWQTPDTSKWIGKSVTLYRDPKVKWAGAQIGGIRISAVSHIDAPTTVSVTESQKERSLRKVGVLTADVLDIKPQTDRATAWANSYMTEVGNAADIATLDAFVESKAEKLAELRTKRPTLADECDAAVTTRRNWLAGDEDTFGGDE